MTGARIAQLCGGTLAAAVLLWFFPLFHFVSPDGAASRSNGPGEDRKSVVTEAFIDKFWNSRLIPACDTAVDIKTLFAAAHADPQAARQQFGRRVGLGGTDFVFVRGTGIVASHDGSDVVLIVPGSEFKVVIQTGVIVGNAVRDATGLADVNRFASSQDFNALSAGLNQRVENHVIASALPQLNEGATIEFAGCGAIRTNSDFERLRLVPVLIEAGKG